MSTLIQPTAHASALVQWSGHRHLAGSTTVPMQVLPQGLAQVQERVRELPQAQEQVAGLCVILQGFPEMVVQAGESQHSQEVYCRTS